MAETERGTKVVYLFLGQSRGEIPSKVTHLQLDSSLTEIPAYAFRQCHFLCEVGYNQGLLLIGTGAFSNCGSLTKANLPPTVIKIGGYAFQYCRKIHSIHLPEGLVKIGESAFEYCALLTTINTPSSITEIEPCAFAHCTSLVELNLAEGLKVIANDAFRGCSSLKKAKFPSTVTHIRHQAFYKCTKLTLLDLPVGLLLIGERVFHGCKALTNVVIPSTVETIEREAFSYCDNLHSVELPPAGLLRLGSGVFGGCISLVNVFLLLCDSPPPPQFGHCIFSGCTDMHSAFQECRYADDGRILDALKNRFDALPVHKLCYFQSHYTLSTNLENLRKTVKSMGAEKVIDDCGKVDCFGMSPFHILALSAKSCLELVKALFASCTKRDALEHRDASGNTPIFYLCTIQASTHTIRAFLHLGLLNRLQNLRLKQWRLAVTNEIDNFPDTDNIALRERRINMIYLKLARYERLEALSLVESVLWNQKMDDSKSIQVEDATTNVQKELQYDGTTCDPLQKLDPIHRKDCRIRSGGDFVISHVLPFLDKLQEPV